MQNKNQPPSPREILLATIAIQNDLADPKKVSEAIDQAMINTDLTYADALKRVAGLDDDSFATLNRFADLKTARNQGNDESALQQTLDRNPGVRDSMTSWGLLNTTAISGSRQDDMKQVSLDDLPISNQYELANIHAQGGLGRVWRTNDRFLSREVAIKEILPNASKQHSVNQRFLREAKITGQLEHPGIVPVYDIGRLTDEDKPFYAMRFVDGETLSVRIKQFHQLPANSEEASLQLRHLLSTMVSICNAVGFAHNRKILHRDLKPDNVILGNFGEVSVLDWGLACRIGDDDQNGGLTEGIATDEADLTVAGTIIGTPAYMAPEQARGDTGQLAETTDIYALGAILYQILTGQPPVVERNLKQLIRKIVEEPVVSPRERKPSVAPPLASICLKALQKIPADRYQSATDLANDIDQFLADEKVSTHDESLSERSRRWIRRHRTLVTSAAAATLVALVGLAMAAILLNAARQRESLAKQEIALQKTAIELAKNDLQTTNLELETANTSLKMANAKVEKSLQETRDAVDNWYTLVATNKELANTPQSSDFRKQLLQKASQYYQKFLSELPEDKSLQVSAAQSHVRLAAIKLELEPGLAAVAHFEQAEKIYTALLDDRPEDRVLQFALAGVYNDKSAAFYQVNQMETSLQLLDKAEAIYAKLAQRLPEELELRFKVATLIANRAEILLKLNQLTECIASFTKTIAAHEQFVEADFEVQRSRQAIGNGYYRRGAARIKLREFDEARRDLEKSIEIRTELCALDDTDPKYRSDLANVLADFGTLALATGDIPAAESTFRNMIEQSEGLATDFPAVPTYQQNLVLAHANLAKALNTAKDLDGALASYRNAKQVSDRLVRNFPKVPQYVSLNSDLAINYGILLANLGRNADAIEQFEAASEIQKQLTEDYPKIIRYAISLVNTRNNLAAMHIRNNDLEKSNQVTDELIEECKQFVDRWPESVDLQLTLAAVHSQRAATRSQLKDPQGPQGAESDFQAALNIRESFSKKYPDNNEVMQDLAESYNNYGVFLTYVDKLKDARVYLNQAVEVRKQLAEREPGVEANTDVAVSTFALAQAHMHDDLEKADQLFSEAIDSFVAAITQSPQYNRAQQYLVLTGQSRAWVRWELGKTKAAIADLEQLLPIQTPRIKHETRVSLAYFCLKSGETEKGIRLLDEASLQSIVTTRAQLDFAAAHALRREIILADETIAEEERNRLAQEQLGHCVDGLKAVLASPDITCRETWESLSDNEDFATVSSTDEFAQLRDSEKNSGK